MKDMQQGLSQVEEIILDYIRSNPGSSKADIIRYMRDKQLASRMTVFEYIKDLEKKDMIYGRKERQNSQSFMMYVNEDNKLTSILGELEEFKEAYVELLEKSKEKINNKDYSVVAKRLMEIGRIKEIDPSKWSERDNLEYINWEHYSENKDYDEWKELDKQLRSLYSLPIKSETETETELEITKSECIEIKTLLDKLIHNLNKVENYEVLFLTTCPIDLFYVFTDIINLRSIWVWPNNIKNKETLSQMYSVIYSKIPEIHIQLSEFIANLKVGFPKSKATADFAEELFMHAERNPSLSLMNLDRYSVLGMKSEIQAVINSLIKLSEEIKDYYYFNLHLIFSINNYEKMKEEIMKALERLK